MMAGHKGVGFVGSSFSPFRLGARLPVSQPVGRPIRHAAISMQKTGKAKKVAPIVFATDMKGKPVWKLRSAGSDDVETATNIIGTLPRSLVEAFVEESERCSLVCEGTVKGTKEGEGYKSRVFGVALVDVSSKVKDADVGASSGFVKTGELIVARVTRDMPDADDVKQKLILGSMKKLKAVECQSVQALVSKSSTDYIAQLKSFGFAVESTHDDSVELVANLAALNPDPQKKIE